MNYVMPTTDSQSVTAAGAAAAATPLRNLKAGNFHGRRRHLYFQSINAV